MLKITETVRPSGLRVLKLEGTLLTAWVEEARAACLDPIAAGPSSLDLSALTFADQAGAQLLHDLLRRGIRIESCSPFVAELLHWKANP